MNRQSLYIENYPEINTQRLAPVVGFFLHTKMQE